MRTIQEKFQTKTVLVTKVYRSITSPEFVESARKGNLFTIENNGAEGGEGF